MNLLTYNQKENAIVKEVQSQVMDVITGNKVASLDLDTMLDFSKVQKVSTQDYKVRYTSRIFNSLRQTTLRSPWDYHKIDKFILKESYCYRAIERQVETMLRNGFEIVSDNETMMSIIKLEISKMMQNTDSCINTLIGEMATRLKKYSIFFVAIERSTKKYKGDNIKVISNIRFIHPSKVTVTIEKGKVIKYYLHDGYEYFDRSKKEITPRDIMFCSFYDNSENFFPVPQSIGSFNDILTLRSIEETVELLCFQFGSPLLHAKVGTDLREGTDVEVVNVHNQIVSMAPNGFITTTNRVKLEVVNMQKVMANIEPALRYFKARVLAGIGTSSITLGEADSANRNTAESVEDALSDNCARVANVICSFFNYKIIPDILESYGFEDKDIFSKDGDPVVKLDFNEMRIEKLISYENHVMNLWQSNAITFDEYRNMLRLPTLNASDIKKLNSNMFPGNENKVGNTTSSLNNPQNQHGAKTQPGSRKD